MMHLKCIQNQEKVNSKTGILKEIIKIRAEINEMENKK
jgi:hypothetical protein